MEQKGLEILRMLEGRDETGAAKAICNVSIQKWNGTDWETIAERNTMGAVVWVYVTDVWLAVDLEFEDRLDWDYLQMAQVCQEYAEMTRVGRLDEVMPAGMVLTLASIGDYDYVFIGRNGFWSFMPDRAEGYCRVIRFVFLKEQCGIYELMESSVEQMIKEAVSDID